MSSITIPAKVNDHPHMRSMNMFRDLSSVADLIELCFAETMDNDGQRYVADMRRASHDDGFLHWASKMTENATLPLTGFVWEENNRIVGNASLIPFRDKGKRIYLIANIAVHPEHRRRGIARILTQRAMKHGWDKKASALWLHVRDDNPAAIQLYQDLGFCEITRRTTWMAKPDSSLPKHYDVLDSGAEIQIVPRHSSFWIQQQEWLRRLHPDVLGWYRSFNFNSLRPGLMNWLYLFFIDANIQQWAAVHRDQLIATLSWAPYGNKSESLFAATISSSNNSNDTVGLHIEGLTELLLHARRTLTSYSKITLDYPAAEMTDAFRTAGFTERRTLLWMRADPAT